MTPNPPADPDVALYQRLRGGDPTAKYDLAERFMEPLVAFLRRASRATDEDLLYQAAGDAIVGLIKNPLRFKPELNTLIGYLRMAARGDLHNAIQKEARHQRNRAGADSVELVEDPGNAEGDDSEGPSFDDPGLAAALADFTPTEQEFFRLLRTGEKRTSVLAAVLGLDDQPEAVKRAEVKRTRDRLIKRLQRAREGT
jgi:RNA polymerase sigma factor (sigma-70 family)